MKFQLIVGLLISPLTRLFACPQTLESAMERRFMKIQVLVDPYFSLHTRPCARSQ